LFESVIHLSGHATSEDHALAAGQNSSTDATAVQHKIQLTEIFWQL
jgi:hypothetical protein